VEPRAAQVGPRHLRRPAAGAAHDTVREWAGAARELGDVRESEIAANIGERNLARPKRLRVTVAIAGARPHCDRCNKS
jgi:hypothetical protein